MDKVENILVLRSRIEILVTVPGLGHGVPVCGFHTRPSSGSGMKATAELPSRAEKAEPAEVFSCIYSNEFKILISSNLILLYM